MNQYGNGYPPGNPPPPTGGHPQQLVQPYGQQQQQQLQLQPHLSHQPIPAPPPQQAVPGTWPSHSVRPVSQPPASPTQPATSYAYNPPNAYAQQHAQQQQVQQQQHAQQQHYAQQPAPRGVNPNVGVSMGLGGFGVGLPGVGGLGNVNTAALNKRVNTMSPAMVFVFFAAAIAVGFLFDVVFTFVHVPFGRYIWYATTILPFALAGMLGALWTRSGKTSVFAAAVIASLIYGACDVGLGITLGGVEGGISMGYIINLAAFSVGISLVGGIGGTIRGAKQKESLVSG